VAYLFVGCDQAAHVEEDLLNESQRKLVAGEYSAHLNGQAHE